jgi:hypothetical protein
MDNADLHLPKILSVTSFSVFIDFLLVSRGYRDFFMNEAQVKRQRPPRVSDARGAFFPYTGTISFGIRLLAMVG